MIGKTVKEKHIDDIWHLVYFIKNSSRVDCVLLNNGKTSSKDLKNQGNCKWWLMIKTCLA